MSSCAHAHPAEADPVDARPDAHGRRVALRTKELPWRASTHSMCRRRTASGRAWPIFANISRSLVLRQELCISHGTATSAKS